MNKIKNILNKFFISVYKLIGLLALACISFGVLGYIFVSIFYTLDKRWIAPIILSPNSDQVIKVKTQYIQQKHLYNKMKIEQVNIESNIDLIKNLIETKTGLKKRYKKAFLNELKAQNKKYAILDQLAQEYEKLKSQILKINGSYTNNETDKLNSLLNSGIIEKETYMQRQLLIIQNLISWVSYNQNEKKLHLEKQDLEDNIKSYRAFIDQMNENYNEKNVKEALYKVLQIEQNYLQLLQEINELNIKLTSLQIELKVINQSMQEYNNICQELENSPYYRASKNKITLAFLPYENLKNVKVGDPVYGCKLGFLFSKKVAYIKGIIEGETSGKHPIFNKDIRGVMVELNVEETNWAEARSLHVGTKPLLIL